MDGYSGVIGSYHMNREPTIDKNRLEITIVWNGW